MQISDFNNSSIDVNDCVMLPNQYEPTQDVNTVSQKYSQKFQGEEIQKSLQLQYLGTHEAESVVKNVWPHLCTVLVPCLQDKIESQMEDSMHEKLLYFFKMLGLSLIIYQKVH